MQRLITKTREMSKQRRAGQACDTEDAVVLLIITLELPLECLNRPRGLTPDRPQLQLA